MGDLWSGSRTETGLGLTVRPNPGVSVSANLDHNDVTLPEGDFTTNLVRLESGWDLSPWASVTGNVQYDDVSEVVGLYMRLRWIIQPGNELFLVFTNNWLKNQGTDLLDWRVQTLSRDGSVKLNYTYRL